MTRRLEAPTSQCINQHDESDSASGTDEAERKKTMSSNGSVESDNDNNSHVGEEGGLPTNNLETLQEDQQQQHEEGAVLPQAAQQPLAPPALAACMTTASSGSSSSNGRRRFGNARLRASFSSGSRSPPAAAAAAAAAASLPRDDNLYDSLVRYQEENDDSTTVSMGETLRSVSTWYSVQSDDDRKIPARPVEGAYEGTYREPIRRPYRHLRGNNNNAAGAVAAAAAGPSTAYSSSSNASCSSASTNTGKTPGQGNNNNITRAAGARFPPPAAAARETSSGSTMSRSVASGPPPVVWEDDEQNEEDDHTCISSLANQTVDRSEGEGSGGISSVRNSLGILDESCAVGSGSSSSEFASLSAPAELAQEAAMGNMVETTRSAPTPYPGGAVASGARSEWETMQWTFANTLSSPHDVVEIQPKPAPSSSGSSANRMMSNANTHTSSSSPSQGPTPAAPSPPPMNDFTRMQQTLGMQDLCVPGATNSRQNSVSGASIHSQQSGGSSLRRNRSGRAQTAAPTQPQSRSASNQGNPSFPSNKPLELQSIPPSSKSGGDPAAQEQYQIWKQIQEEQERKQMELALQLSQQQQAKTREVAPAADFDYPAQNAKPSTGGAAETGAAVDGELDEEEALEVALRISQEEAASEVARGSGNADEEEDEIALALRLSKEQAEADEMRFQQMQQGELSEEEQLRLAMEQSMANSANSERRRAESGSGASSRPQHNDHDDEEMRRALAESLQRQERMEPEDHGDDDDDMALALRLSQAQLEEEERFRKSFLESSGGEDPVLGTESFSDLIQPFPSSSSRRISQPDFDDADYEPPVRSRPSQEPPSPGLPPPGQASGSWGRRPGGRRPGDPHMSGHTPPQPSIQDLESLSQSVRETLHPSEFMGEQLMHDPYMGSQHPKVPPKVHAPDDCDDMRPVSRPQRKDQKPLTDGRPCTSEAQINNVVDIDRDSRDVLVREGQSETRAAIMQGQSQIVTCRGCCGKLHAPVNCSLVFCPTCNTVSQVTGADI